MRSRKGRGVQLQVLSPRPISARPRILLATVTGRVISSFVILRMAALLRTQCMKILVVAVNGWCVIVHRVSPITPIARVINSVCCQ